ncbi:acetyl-CoA carboxylase biotin carboxyl carrier protein [Actinopolyspora biskrensis]|uniref:Biotin carboxyl carrier protein of acetyl-CoA carboxylase n=1 Tax=Actinopolyspora biskrensis TaxID=1470178 RepID=A0A852ZFY9_9ACTN|nr:biotin/lipoyl-containing protein [Actinopolyspora biskrensis]NYH80933.1 acetyl-CoA carboxylase biotin carboxyl carrier protein [Actinopolyspora biskrensis]
MTQRAMNRLEREFDDESTGVPAAGSEYEKRVLLDELLERVRHHSVRFLADVSRSPRSLRVRAGDVSFDIEWSESGHDVMEAGDTASVVTERGDAVTREHDSLVSPTVGVYYEAPEPGAEPFVRAGDAVEQGQQVGIVEAMKLMIPVRAERACRIVEPLKANGESVEYGEALFTVTSVDED